VGSAPVFTSTGRAWSEVGPIDGDEFARGDRAAGEAGGTDDEVRDCGRIHVDFAGDGEGIAENPADVVVAAVVLNRENPRPRAFWSRELASGSLPRNVPPEPVGQASL